MTRDRALKVVLIVVGLLFLATLYPLVLFIRSAPSLSMMLSLYVTLGAFLLLAARNPPAHRSLIAFTAWSSVVHAALMTVQALGGMIARTELIGVGFFLVIAVVLIALAPSKMVPAPRVESQARSA